MRLIVNIALSALMLVAAACGNKNAAVTETTVTQPKMTELPVPQVPDSLTDPADRAAYAVVHFWDAMDFADPAMAADSALVEQSFSNFIALLPYAPDADRRNAVAVLLDRASEASADAYSLLMSTAEHYLWAPESPFFSEELYLPFVDYIIARGGDDAATGEYRRDVIMKNRPGSPAPDCSATGRDGAKVRLSDHGRLTPTLLMFYEPDCDRCHEAIDILAADTALADAVADGRLRFVAVYVGDNVGEWRTHAAGLPEWWRVAIDSDMTIDSRALYDIRATPSFYLLDPDDKILLKDAPLQQIMNIRF